LLVCVDRLLVTELQICHALLQDFDGGVICPGPATKMYVKKVNCAVLDSWEQFSGTFFMKMC